MSESPRPVGRPSADGFLRMSVSIDIETRLRVLRIRAFLEARDGVTFSQSEVLRTALREFEKTLFSKT